MKNFKLSIIGAAIVVVVAASSHHARADDLSSRDVVRQFMVTGLLVADYAQTRDQYVRRAEGYNEINPLVRAHYSEAGIRNYFGVAVVGSAVVTKALPADWRPAWQYGVIALEVAAIVKNKRVGLHFRF